ncbi:MAG: peptide/nickel transport system permease protein, partial [Kosmotogales bacterium]|nr:peptide/nickel transport system permease protein [Kosmotogales bacterium]
MSIIKKLFENKTTLIGTVIILFFIFLAVFAPLITTYNPTRQNLLESLQLPNSKHIFGTDIFGQDIFSRVIYGARMSLYLSSVSVAISAVIGVFLGAVAGYFNKFVDEIIMRFFDILLAFPSILLAIAIMAVLGQGELNLILAISIYSLPRFARITRGTVYAEKQKDYVEAAKVSGESKWSILIRYILPNSLEPIIVQFALRMATAILSIAALGFLGLGVPPPTPEWGTDLALSFQYIQVYPYLGIFPGIAIFLVVIGFNLIG